MGGVEGWRVALSHPITIKYPAALNRPAWADV
jgi:hypothetical protein